MSDDIEEVIAALPPDLVPAIVETAQMVDEVMKKSNDPVLRWLMMQWHSSMAALPVQSRHPKDLLDHIGCISLCMERVGLAGFKPFQTVAARLLEKYHEIHSALPETSATPEADPDHTLH